MTSALLRVPQVAERLDISAYQVRAEHDRGRLPGRRVGRFLRFTEADLETYLGRIAEERPAREQRTGLTQQSAARRRRTA